MAKFAGFPKIPTKEEVKAFKDSVEYKTLGIKLPLVEAFFEYQILNDYKNMLKVASEILKKNKHEIKYLEYTAKKALQNGDRKFAWKTALLAEKL